MIQITNSISTDKKDTTHVQVYQDEKTNSCVFVAYYSERTKMLRGILCPTVEANGVTYGIKEMGKWVMNFGVPSYDITKTILQKLDSLIHIEMNKDMVFIHYDELKELFEIEKSEIWYKIKTLSAYPGIIAKPGIYIPTKDIKGDHPRREKVYRLYGSFETITLIPISTIINNLFF